MGDMDWLVYVVLIICAIGYLAFLVWMNER